MLTPKDIREQFFSATQLKRGYSEKEVDDFLEEVALTVADLIRSNDDLKRLHLDGSAPRTTSFAVVPADAHRLPIVPAVMPIVGEVVVSVAPNATSLLTLAQAVHDQHVADGEEIRNRLILEGQETKSEHEASTARVQDQLERLIEETRERATGILAEANAAKARVEEQIKALLVAKADAHDGMRLYLQEQLAALDATRPEHA